MKEFVINHKKILPKIICVFILFVMYFILYKIYIKRVNAFGCSDDCFNFMGGYFLLKGKVMFSDFFFNHQPFPAFISLFIQYVTHPQSIFELVLRHRQFILLLSFVFNVFLITRFGIKALFFAVLFEFSKFYLFGDRFLAEGIIVYPLIYLLLITLEKYSKVKLTRTDYLLSAVFAWFVIFSREPYIPLAFFSYFLILFGKFTEHKKSSLTIFILLLILTMLSFNLKEYFYNVVTVNFQVTLPAEVKGQLFGGPIQMFFYPFYIFTSGPINIFKNLLIEINVIFLVFYFYLLKEKKYLLFLLIFLFLGISNFKVAEPGKLFYESFHMIIWYAQFIAITVFLIFRKFKNKKIFYTSIALFSAIFLLLIISPDYFAKEKISQQDEFINNFGQTLQEGEAIKAISKPKDTLFLDGSDDLIYFQSGLSSDYKYSWYTSVMPGIKKYDNARLEMFKISPPDFYRDLANCDKTKTNLPIFLQNKYVRLSMDNKPSCIFIAKDIIKGISNEQKVKLSQWHYSIPN